MFSLSSTYVSCLFHCPLFVLFELIVGMRPASTVATVDGCMHSVQDIIQGWPRREQTVILLSFCHLFDHFLFYLICFIILLPVAATEVVAEVGRGCKVLN